jgi:hypothetical protein
LNDAALATITSLASIQLGNFPSCLKARSHCRDCLVVDTEARRHCSIACRRRVTQFIGDQCTPLSLVEVTPMQVEAPGMAALFNFRKAVTDQPRPLCNA